MPTLVRQQIFAVVILAVAAFAALWFFAGSDTVHGAKGGGGGKGKAEFLVIDKDSIDESTPSIVDVSGFDTFCGGPVVGPGNATFCINDDIAFPGGREILFTRPRDITPYGPLELPTGQTGGEGLFRFTLQDPQLSLQNSAQFTTYEFMTATGAAASEDNLDKIAGVVPLDAAYIASLDGKTVCAVVYDDDITVNLDEGWGSLKGAALGLTAFQVTAVGEADGSVLPPITVTLLRSGDVLKACESATSGTGTKGGGGSGPGGQGGGKDKPPKPPK